MVVDIKLQQQLATWWPTQRWWQDAMTVGAADTKHSTTKANNQLTN
jgi:hypothetical protein